MLFEVQLLPGRNWLSKTWWAMQQLLDVAKTTMKKFRRIQNEEKPKVPSPALYTLGF